MPKRQDIKSILIIGAGPIIIGQACEFDYSGTQECKALKDEGRIGPDGLPVIRRIHKIGKIEADPLRGLFPLTVDGKSCVIEYEPDGDLRDTETVPLMEPGGIEAFIRREVLPHAPDAWFDEAKTAIGYEISFTRYFYKPHALRPLTGHRPSLLLPASLLGGAILVLLADVGLRLVQPWADLRIGVLTALLGAPFFVWLVVRTRAELAP